MRIAFIVTSTKKSVLYWLDEEKRVKHSTPRLGPGTSFNPLVWTTFRQALFRHFSEFFRFANSLRLICLGAPLNFSIFSGISHIE